MRLGCWGNGKRARHPTTDEQVRPHYAEPRRGVSRVGFSSVYESLTVASQTHDPRCALARARISGSGTNDKSTGSVRMFATRDLEIRVALHERKLGAFRNAPNTIVIDELGLSHAKVRIDVAVINGCVHGYEIKSSLDTLDRLPAQLQFYNQCLEKLTLVCAPCHIDGALEVLPEWCGILEVRKGRRGGISFSTIRRTKINPEIDPVQLAHLLWRPEALALLTRLGVSGRTAKMSRKELYEVVAAHLNVKQLTAAIRESMQQRRAWRDPQVHA